MIGLRVLILAALIALVTFVCLGIPMLDRGVNLFVVIGTGTAVAFPLYLGALKIEKWFSNEKEDKP